MRTTFATLLLAGVAVATLTTDVSARGRRHAIQSYDTSSLNNGEALTVNRRSWLDPGNAVHSGVGGASYMSASTQYNKTQDQIYAPDTFGNDVMKGQPYVPGRSVHIVEFSSLPNGDAQLDNVLGPQNYYLNPAVPELPRQAATAPLFQSEVGYR